METYSENCGKCIYCDLYDKNGSHFRCTAVSGRWVLALDKKCSRFVPDGKKTPKMIDYAREHTNGLK